MDSDSSVDNMCRRVVRGVEGCAGAGRLYGCPKGIGVVFAVWRGGRRRGASAGGGGGSGGGSVGRGGVLVLVVLLLLLADRLPASAANFCCATLVET
jgi:hypothetical protein